MHARETPSRARILDHSLLPSFLIQKGDIILDLVGTSVPRKIFSSPPSSLQTSLQHLCSPASSSDTPSPLSFNRKPNPPPPATCLDASSLFSPPPNQKNKNIRNVQVEHYFWCSFARLSQNPFRQPLFQTSHPMSSDYFAESDIASGLCRSQHLQARQFFCHCWCRGV